MEAFFSRMLSDIIVAQKTLPNHTLFFSLVANIHKQNIKLHDLARYILVDQLSRDIKDN